MKQICCRLLLLVLGCGMILHPQEVHALDPAKNLSQYNCQNWTRQSGLPANGVNAITQTKDGYIWLGTQKGLVRFDGDEFKLFLLPPQPLFRRQSISALSPAADGGLWFGINNSAFGHFDGADGFLTMSAEPWVTPIMNVVALRELTDGSLWMGADGGGARFAAGSTNAGFVADQIGSVTAICEGSHGRIWLGTADHGLYYWEQGKLTPFPDAALQESTIHAIAEDEAGQIWVGTGNGLRCYDAAFQPKPLLTLYREIRALLVDQRGAVWIGTSGDGLGCFKNGQLTFLHQQEGLVNDYVTALFEDHEGSLWVGTREGLSHLGDVKLPILSAAEGLPNQPVHGVAVARDGGLWVATSMGIAKVTKNGVTTNFAGDTGLTNNYVKRVFESRSGDVYAITGNKDIEIISAGRVVARHANSTWPIAFAEDAQGMIVAIGANLFRVSRDQLVPYPFKNGQAPAFYWIRDLCLTRNGALLVASSHGVFRIKDGEFEQWVDDSNKSEMSAHSVLEDADGFVWAGLATGIVRLKQGQVSHFTRANGLLENYVYALGLDDHDWFWVNSSSGIYRVSRRSLNAVADGRTNQVECQAFDGLDSVKTTDTTEVEYLISKTPDGRLWLPSPQGVIQIDPQNLPTNRVAPPVRIQQARVNGLDMSARKPVVAPPGRGEVEIKFVALSYITPQKIRYRYQLEGYDANWIDAGSRQSAFYTNLKPGSYHFQLQACNADGIWNAQGDRFEFTLLPHYYQTVWFKLLAGLLVVAILAGIYLWRFRHLQTRQNQLHAANELLESRILERTRELAEQRNLLRTLIDHLPDNVFVKDLQSRVVLNNQAHAHHLGVSNPQAVVGKTDFDFFPQEIAEPFYKSEQQLFKTGEPFNGVETSQCLSTGELRWTRTTKVPLHDSEGKLIGLAGINRDITEQKQAAETIAQERELLRTLIDLLPDTFYIKDLDGRFLVANNALTKHLGKETHDQILGRTDADFFPAKLAAKYRAEELKVLGGEPLIDHEGAGINRDGRECTHLTTKVPFRDSQGKIIGLVGIGRDITARKQWETRLESLHRQLVEASRQAGMAEVATSVLHNVGNVLNSVNVSASLLSDRVKHSAADNLERVSRLLREHQDDLAHFLTQDEKGGQLVRYLETLVKQLAGEKIGTLQEIECLVRNIDHIKEIVTLQQSHNRPVGVQEILDPTTLIEDAIGMQAASFARHQIQFRREFASVPTISVDRHKVIQILVNLLQNAKRACKEKTGIAGEVILRVGPAGPDRIKIEVEDNGIGIPAENLTRIFAYGFTTRKNGHGFGLHSGALAAKQMGGSLQARSAGSGQGARFTLELPRQPEPNTDDSPAGQEPTSHSSPPPNLA